MAITYLPDTLVVALHPAVTVSLWQWWMVCPWVAYEAAALCVSRGGCPHPHLFSPVGVGRVHEVPVCGPIVSPWRPLLRSGSQSAILQ